MKHVVLQLPGWLGSGPSHWQSLWEQQWGDQRVEQVDWQRPLRGDWQIALQEHMWRAQPDGLDDGEAPTRFVLVAHSLGCHLVAAWAAHSPHVDWVSAALLVAPPDLSLGQTLALQLPSWSPPMMQALPFPSLMISSDNDDFASHEASLGMAQAWACRHQVLHQAGHINAESGLGSWPEGRAMLRDWLASTT